MKKGNQTKRVVVKIGSSLITDNGRGLAISRLSDWTRQISELTDEGFEIILVSSGAVAEGMTRLGWENRPKMIHELQAAAAIGQMGLIRAYEDSFSTRGIKTAQILLTHDDLTNRKRYLNARSTLKTLIDLGILPIVNENDSVATEEIRFGDNDTLAALVANLVEADLLIILTDQDGLFTGDPRSSSDVQIVHTASVNDSSLEEMATDSGSHIGSGGMITKLRAAKRAARSGTHTHIANGKKADVLLKLMAGESTGTKLTATAQKIKSKKQWLSSQIQVSGVLEIDEGATKAITENRSSLLPIGVVKVSGKFERGDIVACHSPSGKTIAHGLVNYNSKEANRISGLPSEKIESELGYVDELELINRDNLSLEEY